MQLSRLSREKPSINFWDSWLSVNVYYVRITDNVYVQVDIDIEHRNSNIVSISIEEKKTFRVIQYTGNALLLAYRQKFDKWLRKLPKIDFVHEIVAETLQYPSSNAPVTSSDEWMQAKTNYFSSTYSPIISL